MLVEARRTLSPDISFEEEADISRNDSLQDRQSPQSLFDCSRIRGVNPRREFECFHEIGSVKGEEVSRLLTVQ